MWITEKVGKKGEKSNEKIKFYLNGVEIVLQKKYLKEFDYNGNKIPEPYIDGGRVAAASIIIESLPCLAPDPVCFNHPFQ